MTERTTEEVLRDHLRRRAAGDLEGDLEHNYADDIALLCKSGVFQGCDALRASAEILGLQIPGANYDYLSVQTFEESGFLEWRAESDTVRIDDGADSYLIRDGRIQVQTIHYTPISKD
ncbi:MAG: nuclear transport factor 2 family protein [Thermomicrobiales bacterium]|nr:nuclear transport factor 2 family protein [Thermomicrobiales bacterium]